MTHSGIRAKGQPQAQTVGFFLQGVYDAADNLVENINGCEYCSITTHEDTCDRFTSRMTFMVRVDGKAILVDDDLSDSDESRYITLDGGRILMTKLISMAHQYLFRIPLALR